MAALNWLQFELPQQGEEVSTELWGEQELYEDLDVAEYPDLFGE